MKARLAAAAVLLAAMTSCGEPATRDAREPAASTAAVEAGPLSAMVSVNGILTYRSPRSVVNRADGTYTDLPAAGEEVGCGDELYRVDDDPVLLLCGRVPAYRRLDVGDKGRDVRQLNRNLRRLGHAAGAGGEFTAGTEAALEELGDPEFVFLPGPVRIAKVTGRLGGPARPGAVVAQATSDRLEVRADLEPSQQGQVKAGDRARIVLPGNRAVTGRVDRLGSVARTLPVHLALARPRQARGLHRAPVQVEIRTKGVQHALSVPVTALVGKAGGGFAVEVARGGGRRELVAVRVGLFDTTAGRVAVEGGVREGDRVVVPAS